MPTLPLAGWSLPKLRRRAAVGAKQYDDMTLVVVRVALTSRNTGFAQLKAVCYGSLSVRLARGGSLLVIPTPVK